MKFNLKVKNLNFKIIIIIKLFILNFLLCPEVFKRDNALYADNLISKEIINREFLYNKKQSFNSYILGAGDVIILRIKKEEDIYGSFKDIDRSNLISGEYLIEGDGSLDLKRLNKVFVEGLTTTELKNLLDKEYSEFIINPDIQIKIKKYRPLKVYLTGEVNKPGFHVLSHYQRKDSFTSIDKKNSEEIFLSDQITNNISPFLYVTLFDAIRAASGITNYANLGEVEVIRKNSISNGGGKISTTVSLINVLKGEDLPQNLRLYDGDIIKVSKSNKPSLEQLSMAFKANLNPEKIEVFVTGRVNIPGKVITPQSSTVNDAIEIAGGTKFLKGNIKLIRYDKFGNIQKNTLRYKKSSKKGTKNNPYLKSGDLIIVNKGVFKSSSEIITDFTEPFAGIISTYGLYRALD
jgi:polysaccharide export outer membrane protein